MRNRKVQRELKKTGVRKEEMIDRVDFCGIRQPTPYQAVKNIVRNQRWAETRAKNTTTGSATAMDAAV